MGDDQPILPQLGDDQPQLGGDDQPILLSVLQISIGYYYPIDSVSRFITAA